MVTLKVFDEPAALAREVAHAMIQRLSRTSQSSEDPITPLEVALTGGTIARAIHRQVGAQSAGVPWGQVRFWFGDERFVPAESPDRNALQAREDFLDGLTPPPFAVMEVPAVGEVDSVARAASTYSEQLRHQGTGSWDLVMLGLGPDGHIASLFPHHPAAQIRDAIAVAVTDSPKPPPERVSLTFEALGRNTRAVWFVVSGADKAQAVARSLDPTQDVSSTPVRGLLERLPPECEVVWWLDKAAASEVEAAALEASEDDFA